MATASVSLIHPDLYNRVLRAYGIKNVRAVDRDTRMIVRVDDGTNAVGELVSALTTAHFALIAATSHVNTMRDAISTLRALEWPTRSERLLIEDTIRRLATSVDTLDGLTPAA